MKMYAKSRPKQGLSPSAHQANRKRPSGHRRRWQILQQLVNDIIEHEKT